MKPKTKYLDLLIDNFSKNYSSLFLSDVFSYDRISYLFNKKNPFKITKQEYLKIKSLLELIEYESQISTMVKLEIDKSIERRIEKKFHLENYLHSIYHKMDFPMNVIYLGSEIKRLKEDSIFMEFRQFTPELNTKEIENSILVSDFIKAHLKHYNNFKEIQEYIRQKQLNFGFLPSLKENNLEVQPITPTKGGATLKSQFINPLKYEEVINILELNGNIKKHLSGKLSFLKCHRRGTKYGVEALRLVLKDLEYLKGQSGLTNAQIVEIHKNTYN